MFRTKYSPGCSTLTTLGSFSRNLATANPFVMCCLILRASVFIPRFTRNESKGEGTTPIAKIQTILYLNQTTLLKYKKLNDTRLFFRQLLIYLIYNYSLIFLKHTQLLVNLSSVLLLFSVQMLTYRRSYQNHQIKFSN